ncbi:MAG: sigma 54-interacting transcriptional regulator, partial [Myxococcota bacterium]
VEPLTDGDGAVVAAAVFGDEIAPRRPPSRPPTASVASPVAAVVPAGPDAFAEVFAEDAATVAAVGFARRVAASELPIVLLSETGSGKELFAAAIHRASKRADGPFVAVNCGSVAPALLESELFGYAPGSFTGADRHGRDGLFHAASGGTLFLDEAAEMSPAMQTSLLRVLETRRYHRVGETAERAANVRVVCATCKDLPALVASGAFRQDLYYRLKGVQILLPPLRARTDRLALAQHLLARAAADDGEPAPAIGPALAAWITGYGWPGNVRELKSVLEVARVLAAGTGTLGVEHLPPDLAGAIPAGIAGATIEPGPGDAPLAEVERWAVERALAELGGNVSAAARRLGIARSTIYRMLARS